MPPFWSSLTLKSCFHLLHLFIYYYYYFQFLLIYFCLMFIFGQRSSFVSRCCCCSSPPPSVKANCKPSAAIKTKTQTQFRRLTELNSPNSIDLFNLLDESPRTHGRIDGETANGVFLSTQLDSDGNGYGRYRRRRRRAAGRKWQVHQLDTGGQKSTCQPHVPDDVERK